MKKPTPNPDRQNNLLRPLASELDSRERKLLEENLAAIRELCNLLRESATDPEDKILPALRQLESRLEALPEALRGTIRQAVDDCLTAASQETRKTKPSDDISVEEEIIDQIGKIHQTLRFIDNHLSGLNTTISAIRSQWNLNSFQFWTLMLISAIAGMLIETLFQPIRQLLIWLWG